MDGFERRRERKKENIRRAALELFTTHGVQKVSVAEIARKANVSQVTIYNYFGSKSDLLRDAIKKFMEETWENYHVLLAGDAPFPDKIKQMILEEVRYAEELDPDFLKALISNDPEIKQMLDEFYKNTYLPALIEFFDQGRKEGYVNPDISNEALIAYMNIFKDGFRPDILNDREQNPRLAKEMITLFFYGLLEKRPES